MERGEGPGAGLGAALEAAQGRGAAEAVERALARYNEEVTGGERGAGAGGRQRALLHLVGCGGDGGALRLG